MCMEAILYPSVTYVVISFFAYVFVIIYNQRLYIRMKTPTSHVEKEILLFNVNVMELYVSFWLVLYNEPFLVDYPWNWGIVLLLVKEDVDF